MLDQTRVDRLAKTVRHVRDKPGFSHACLGLVSILLANAAFAATSSELEALVNSGRYADAYQLGVTSQPERDDRLFSYFFGVAAVDSKHLNEGVQLLSNYIEGNPNDPRGRIELARAYFLAGYFTKAQQEFLVAKTFSLPAEVAANIDIYLKAIEERNSGVVSTSDAMLASYLEVGMGVDSNINGGVSGSSITLPIIGTATLDDGGVRKSATFMRVAAGTSGQYTFDTQWFGFAEANLEARGHSRNDDYDNHYISTLAGFGYQPSGNQTVRAGLGYNTMDLNGAAYRSSPNALVGWQMALDHDWLYFANVQQGQLHYRGSNEQRNARFVTLVAGFRKSFVAEWTPALLVSANVGEERNKTGRDDLSRDGAGMRVGVELMPMEHLMLSIGYAEQSSRYRADDLFFGMTRKDYAKSVDLAATWAMAAQWTLRGEVSWTDTNSNLELNKNRRSVAAVNVRYTF